VLPKRLFVVDGQAAFRRATPRTAVLLADFLPRPLTHAANEAGGRQSNACQVLNENDRPLPRAAVGR